MTGAADHRALEREEDMAVAATRDVVLKCVSDALVEIGLEPEQITPDATLASLELDSLDIVELAQIVEDKLDVALKPEDARGMETLDDVVEMIRAKME